MIAESSIPSVKKLAAHRQILVQPESGWVEIRTHEQEVTSYWQPCVPFAVAMDRAGLGLQPLLTLRQMRAICVEGRYAPFHRVQPDRLRRPEEILESQSPVPVAEDSVPAGLTWEEAELFCRLAGGTLADETQVLYILRHLIPANWPNTRLPNVPGWTRSPWSEWSEALRAFDAGTKRWIAAGDRILPDLVPGTAQRTRIHAGSIPGRHSGSSGPLPAHDAGAAAWLVYPP